ncbi:regucalcin-like isoform X2 [Cylas formicarius]|uniref:regucalcin-like isoform X2 n=1 Tax=Cylas formicarius TaxID=197179 RepID=UPI00295892ED|nr:regucalcin-like isoform X2 [Cylas formicarius]
MYCVVLLVTCGLLPHLGRGQQTGAPTSTEQPKPYKLKEAPNFNTPGVYQLTPPVDHAEGPAWDGRKNVLYYVDIHSGRVLSYNFFTRSVSSITLNGQVSPVIPSKNNENLLIVGVNRTLVALEWDGEKELGNQRVLTTVSQQFPTSRFNDGKADKMGRLWIGTMGFEDVSKGTLTPNEGVLYRVTKDTLISPSVKVAPVNISNGIAWTKANDKMYYIDTPTRQVIEYDFDAEKGDISNGRVAIDVSRFPTLTGNPDGMTIDADDNLWIALYGGGAVIKANPKNGQLLQVVPIPSRDVTSVAWGGPNLDVLFVTTSRVSLTPAQRKEFPAAGSVFAMLNAGTKGLPIYGADLVDSIRRGNLLADLILSTNDLFAPPVSNDITNLARSNLQKKPEDQTANKPFWMTMLNTLRNIF